MLYGYLDAIIYVLYRTNEVVKEQLVAYTLYLFYPEHLNLLKPSWNKNATWIWQLIVSFKTDIFAIRSQWIVIYLYWCNNGFLIFFKAEMDVYYAKISTFHKIWFGNCPFITVGILKVFRIFKYQLPLFNFLWNLCFYGVSLHVFFQYLCCLLVHQHVTFRVTFKWLILIIIICILEIG